jgi:hypothetical protein
LHLRSDVLGEDLSALDGGGLVADPCRQPNQVFSARDVVDSIEGPALVIANANDPNDAAKRANLLRKSGCCGALS